MSAATRGYDPFAPEVMADPYPSYAWLRSCSPVHHVPERGIWVLSRYDDVRAALRDHGRLSSTAGVGYGWRPVPMMIALDPPEHTRLRRIVQREFVPSAVVARWGGRVEALVAAHLDDALGRGTCDLAQVVASPLPVRVIAELLGVPPDDWPAFKRWSEDTVDALGGALDPVASARAEASVAELGRYCHEAGRARRAAPGDDLLSLLVAPGDDTLADHEVSAFAVLLLVAGNETTSDLVTNLVQALVDHPDQWALLRRRPELVPAAVEEALRFDAPIQGFFRNTLVDVEVRGVRIPAGEKVLVLYGSANRDEAHFPRADRFLVERNPPDHLAFGAGVHHCLGAPLARLQATTLLRGLLARVERVEPAGPVQRTANPLFRGLAHLPVTLVPR